MSTYKRIKHLVKTTAEIAADAFAGRAGWNSTLSRWIAYYDSTHYGVCARNDVLETFSGGIVDPTLTAALPIATNASKRHVTLSAEAFRALIDAAQTAHTHTVANLSNLGANWPELLTSANPTTLAGYGITDAQPFDSDLTAIAALTTQAFGRSLLTQADAAAARATIGTLAASEKGSANGIAPLGSDSKIASTYLPSYVDDVIEVANYAALPGTGEAGKIYVTLDTNLTYRWSGSAYVKISASLALGETSSTAYRGDRGKTAYDHSQITAANPHSTTAAQVGAVAKSGDTMTGPLVAPSLTASNITEGQIVLGGASGVLKSESGLRYANSFLTVGDATGSALVFVDGAPSGNSGMFLQAGGITRWSHLRVATSQSWILRAHDALGATIDSPISITNAAGGGIILGGSTARPVRLTGILLDAGGVQRMSAAGRIDASSLYNSAWGGSGIRPLLTDNAGMGYATDAATFRGAIGAASTNRLGSEAATSIYISGSDGYFYDGFTPFASFGGNKFGVDALYDFYRNATWISKNEGGYADSGRFYCRNGLWVGLSGIELQVVGGRKTGWSAATGTASRSTFATSSVTLPQLAERVKALLDDLISHGLIGA